MKKTLVAGLVIMFLGCSVALAGDVELLNGEMISVEILKVSAAGIIVRDPQTISTEAKVVYQQTKLEGLVGYTWLAREGDLFLPWNTIAPDLVRSMDFQKAMQLRNNEIKALQDPLRRIANETSGVKKAIWWTWGASLIAGVTLTIVHAAVD